MTEPESRPVPLLGDVPLEHGQRVEHALDGGFVDVPVAGLGGAVQQRTARPSHRIVLDGLLLGPKAADYLDALQTAAAAGEELTFSADVTRALSLQRVVVRQFRVVEEAGQPGVYRYALVLAESPPLPPPATVDPFGGLGDFGAGQLGFDTDILGDLQDAAAQVAGAVDAALDVVGALDALAGLDGLGAGGLVEPLAEPVGALRDLGSSLSSAASGLAAAFS